MHYFFRRSKKKNENIFFPCAEAHSAVVKGKTNPKGPGTETFSVNMPKADVSRLRQLATASDVSLSKYCKRILTAAAIEGRIFDAEKYSAPQANTSAAA